MDLYTIWIISLRRYMSNRGEGSQASFETIILKTGFHVRGVEYFDY